jgi:aspartyl-tRNA(Asn)/glutamyl-tRNA(Gln) amidotransferase subunit A
MDKGDIGWLSVTQTVEAVRGKEVSPVEVVEALLKRIECLNPCLNAYCTIAADNARCQAQEAEAALLRGGPLGPLHGVPVAIKDLIFTQGIRTTSGSRLFQHFVPQQDAIVVERLRAAGAIIMGKTNTSEFGWMAGTGTHLFGETHNPWDLAYNAGGVSEGEGAVVAAGLAPLAIGGDFGGSIRIAASMCGVFGFKPSFGRVPQYPAFPIWETLSHTGPLTRTVADAALVMEIIAGRDDRDRFTLSDKHMKYQDALSGDLKGLRIAFSKDLGYAVVDPEVARLTESAARVFSSLGANVEAAHPEVRSPERVYSSLIAVMLAAILQDKLETGRDLIGLKLVHFLEQYKSKTAFEYGRACRAQLEYWEGIWPFFAEHDLLVTPTLAVPPFKLGRFGPREIDGKKVTMLDWMAFTYPFNITGQPAASLPCGFSQDGLPIGLQLVGRRFDDRTVLRAAAAFEQARPWTKRRPAPPEAP